LGYKPVYKPIIPRCSFFDKGHFLALTGMFSLVMFYTERAIPQRMALKLAVQLARRTAVLL
jgi:hypothetical protein